MTIFCSIPCFCTALCIEIQAVRLQNYGQWVHTTRGKEDKQNCKCLSKAPSASVGAVLTVSHFDVYSHCLVNLLGLASVQLRLRFLGVFALVNKKKKFEMSFIEV